MFFLELFLSFQRGDNVPKVLVFSEEGYFLHSWNDTVEMPHGIFVWNTATGSSVWLTDVGTGMHHGDMRNILWGRKCNIVLKNLNLSSNSEIDLCFTCHKQTSHGLHKIA